MPIRFNFELKWGKAADKKTVTPSSHTHGKDCSCSSSSSSSSSTKSKTKTKAAPPPPAPVVVQVVTKGEQQPPPQPATLVVVPKAAPPKPPAEKKPPTKRPQHIIFVRNGESAEMVFPSWVKLSVVYGQYRRYNANLPERLPERRHGYEAFHFDPPLTCLGQKMSCIVAASLAKCGRRPSIIYAASTYRSIETASFIFTVLGMTQKIRVEPGLTSFRGREIAQNRPTWMTTAELQQSNFPIDAKYVPLHQPDAILSQPVERVADMCVRIATVVKKISAAHPVGVALIVCGAKTIHIGLTALAKTRMHQLEDLPQARHIFKPGSAAVVTGFGETGFDIFKEDQLPAFTTSSFSTAAKLRPYK